jgi:hypothetical protein
VHDSAREAAWIHRKIPWLIREGHAAADAPRVAATLAKGRKHEVERRIRQGERA